MGIVTGEATSRRRLNPHMNIDQFLLRHLVTLRTQPIGISGEQVLSLSVMGGMTLITFT